MGHLLASRGGLQSGRSGLFTSAGGDQVWDCCIPEVEENVMVLGNSASSSSPGVGDMHPLIPDFLFFISGGKFDTGPGSRGHISPYPLSYAFYKRGKVRHRARG